MHKQCKNQAHTEKQVGEKTTIGFIKFGRTQKLEQPPTAIMVYGIVMFELSLHRSIIGRHKQSPLRIRARPLIDVHIIQGPQLECDPVQYAFNTEGSHYPTSKDTFSFSYAHAIYSMDHQQLRADRHRLAAHQNSLAAAPRNSERSTHICFRKPVKRHRLIAAQFARNMSDDKCISTLIARIDRKRHARC